jgi:glycerol-3-phosphate acyltransferase PlsX
MAGVVDVIVSDGFTGNVALKTLEGALRFAAGELREALTGTRTAKIGALLQRRGLRELNERLNSESYGGAVLLGMGGTVVIAHGASTARAVSSACALAGSLSRGNITERIRERLGPPPERRFRPRQRDRDRLIMIEGRSHSHMAPESSLKALSQESCSATSITNRLYMHAGFC